MVSSGRIASPSPNRCVVTTQNWILQFICTEPGGLLKLKNISPNLRAAKIPYSLKSKPRLWLKDALGENRVLSAEVTDVRLRWAYLTIPSIDGQVFLDYTDLRDFPPVAGSTLDVNVYYKRVRFTRAPSVIAKL